MPMKVINEDAHCSECIHYEACTNYQMYCKALKRQITARKTPRYCKHYKSFIRGEAKVQIKASELTNVKMSVNPPQALVDSDYKLIHRGKVKCWVGIGWVEERPAAPEDFDTLPVVVDG